MRTWALLIARALLLVFVVADLHSVIIVVHGTFATAERWHQADGDFVQALRSSYAYLPATCPQKNSPIVSFSWTGANCSSARIRAAKNLAALIASYPATEKMYLIAHSHAGNVVALTTHLLKKAGEAVDNSLTRGDVSVWPATLRQAADAVGLPCTLDDCALLQDAVRFLAVANPQNVPMRSLGVASNSSPKIQRIYFLATPVDVSRYACEMSCVDTCYALFSKGDWVQPVGGFYQRSFPLAPRFLNIEVVTVLSEKKIQLPGHADLRKPCIGEWLLLVPSLIEAGLGLVPEKYGECQQVVLALLPNGAAPVITTHVFEKDGNLNEVIKASLEKNALGPCDDLKEEKRPEDLLPVLI